MLTAEQRYEQARRKAIMQWKRQNRRWLEDKEPFAESLAHFERRAIINEIARCMAALTNDQQT